MFLLSYMFELMPQSENCKQFFLESRSLFIGDMATYPTQVASQELLD